MKPQNKNSIRSYKTFVEEYPDKKIYVRVKFAGSDKDVQNYDANEVNKKRAIAFAKRLAEKNNGTYEGFQKITLAEGIKGVYDKGILKAVFLAGGSGSGKSAVSNALFGLNFGFAPSGLKNVNNDKFFEFLLEKGKLSKDMTNLNDKEMSIIQDVRKKGKALGISQYQMYLNGRLGMVIDGTGDSYSKISEQKKYLQSLGYDCIMVFVNTTLNKALERNMKRERKVPVDVATTIWKAAQQMKKRYATLFKNNFTEIDNSTDSPTGRVQIANKIQKKIDTFLNAPVKNPKGKAWIKSELAKKKNKSEGEFVFV